jgi:hypothetical protein
LFLPALAELKAQGKKLGGMRPNQIATPSGKPWSAVTVLRVQRRLEGL